MHKQKKKKQSSREVGRKISIRNRRISRGRRSR
jgi:hypothetical protein